MLPLYYFWWRRRESNPRPRSLIRFLYRLSADTHFVSASNALPLHRAHRMLASSLQASVGKALNLLSFPIPLCEALSIPRERMERPAFFLGKAAFAAMRRRHMRSRCRLLVLPLDKGASGAPACKSQTWYLPVETISSPLFST